MTEIIEVPGKDIVEYIERYLPYLEDSFIRSQGEGAFDVDVEMYDALAERDLLYCIGAFDGEKMKGYAIYILTYCMHSSSMSAFCSSIYTQENGFLVKRLIKRAEKDMIERGASGITYGIPYEGSFGKLLGLLGYPPKETTYHKGL